MAEYFAADGWNDITVAFPVNVHEIERINSLAGKIALNLLVVNPEACNMIGKAASHSINIFIEVDNGYHRTGVAPSDFESIDQILNEVRKHSKLKFKGFLGHAGHSYKANGDRNKILSIHKESIGVMLPLKEKYKSEYPDLILSTGDTPTCSVAEGFLGADEIRPGNLVFYDVAQNSIGSCSLDQVAVAMACPVVATYPDRNEVIIYGGGVHFSKDFLMLPNGAPSFGKVVNSVNGGWSTEETGMYVKSLSQEHGIVHAPKEVAEKIKIGDFLTILPIHSCLTADAMNSYLIFNGERISQFSF